MVTHLSCQNCRSRKVLAMRIDRDSNQVQWQCQECGNTCKHLRKRSYHSARMDLAVGLAVLFGMLTFAVALCLT
jgi:transcription elongation factor Elf1